MNDAREQGSHARSGDDWEEPDDFLIGDRESLLSLQAAIDEALKEGESTREAGGFLGVRCLPSDFFLKGPDRPSFWSQLMGWAVGISLMIMFAVGMSTISAWFGSGSSGNCG